MRVLLKISGEVLAGDSLKGFDFDTIDEIIKTVKDIKKEGIELAIVVGGGNLVRGVEIKDVTENYAHYMGMLASSINTIALTDRMTQKGLKVKSFHAYSIDGWFEKFNREEAIKAIENGKILIFGGGIGNPFFTTDTGAVLKAIEIEADIVIKATKVNGVYDKDPVKYKDAKFIEKATYDEVITKNLRVMDMQALALARDNDVKIKVVSLYEKGAILKAIKGKKIGTTIE